MAGAAIAWRGGFSNVGRWLGVQLGVSVLAAAVVAGFFAVGRTPAPPVEPMVSDAGKSLRRVADGAIETKVLRFDPQQQAARASIASFTPTAAPLPPPVVVRTAPSKQTALVLPPRRPAALGVTQTAAAPEGPPPTSVAASPAVAGNWKVAGIEIPGSARMRRFVPSGSDLLKPADIAWTASKNAVKKVASLGSFFGL